MANKHLSIGPGGRKCACCFPAPGSKSRKSEYRSAKRKEKQEAMKQAEKDMLDTTQLRDDLAEMTEIKDIHAEKRIEYFERAEKAEAELEQERELADRLADTFQKTARSNDSGAVYYARESALLDWRTRRNK